MFVTKWWWIKIIIIIFIIYECQFGEQSKQFLNWQVGSSLPCDCQIVTWAVGIQW